MIMMIVTIVVITIVVISIVDCGCLVSLVIARVVMCHLKRPVILPATSLSGSSLGALNSARCLGSAMAMLGVPAAEYLAKLKAWLVLAVCVWVSVCSQVDLDEYVLGLRQSHRLGGSRHEFDQQAVNDLCCAPWQVRAAVTYFAHHCGLVGRALCC